MVLAELAQAVEAAEDPSTHAGDIEYYLMCAVPNIWLTRE